MARTFAVVVTGASSGIGEACALRLARRGARVFAGVRNDADADRLRAAGPGLVPVRLDVTDAASIAAAAAQVREAVGDAGIAGLVNNAGVAVAGPLEYVPIDEFRRQLEVNVTGQLAVTQAFLPLVRTGRGRIVNMGSISGRSALPFIGPYAASKHALEALTDSLRVELRPWGIDVVVVEPGVIATPIWATSLAAADRMRERLPARAFDLYGAIMESIARRVAGNAKAGLPADAVAAAVEHALTAPKPRTRYLVGRDARLRAWIERLPDRWRDRIIASRIRPGPTTD